MNAVAWLLLALPQSLPPVSLDDLQRFAPLETCEAHVRFNSQYQQHLRGALALYPLIETPRHTDHPERYNLENAAAWAYHLWYVWDCLRVAQDPREPRPQRLYWLGVLRDRIGLDAYAAGAMPPPVPIWLFRSVD